MKNIFNFYSIVYHKCNFCKNTINHSKITWKMGDTDFSTVVYKSFEKSRSEIIFVDSVGSTFEVDRSKGLLISCKDYLNNTVCENSSFQAYNKECFCNNINKTYTFIKQDDKFIEFSLLLDLSERYQVVYNFTNNIVVLQDNSCGASVEIGKGISMNKFHYMFDSIEKIQNYLSVLENVK